MMLTLFTLLTFIGVFCVFDAVRKLNDNILNQTKEIQGLREDLKQRNRD